MCNKADECKETTRIDDKECSIQIAVATHKEYVLPKDRLYLPLFVGAALINEVPENYLRDDLGDNISSKNLSYCELTGLYWMWKNSNADYVGLVHYRRYFSLLKSSQDKYESILTYEQILTLVNRYRVIIPKKRWYLIETLYSHYAHTHYAEHLNVVGRLINKRFPDYIDNYKRVLSRRWGYMFNMMVMEKELFDLYCKWLFKILFVLEPILDQMRLKGFQGRLYGRISEILFNVWLDHEIESGKIERKECIELKVICMERVKWFKKSIAFLKAKFLGIKYESGF